MSIYIKSVETSDPAQYKQPLPLASPCYLENLHPKSYKEKVCESHTKQAVTGQLPHNTTSFSLESEKYVAHVAKNRAPDIRTEEGASQLL